MAAPTLLKMAQHGQRQVDGAPPLFRRDRPLAIHVIANARQRHKPQEPDDSEERPGLAATGLPAAMTAA